MKLIKLLCPCTTNKSYASSYFFLIWIECKMFTKKLIINSNKMLICIWKGVFIYFIYCYYYKYVIILKNNFSISLLNGALFHWFQLPKQYRVIYVKNISIIRRNFYCTIATMWSTMYFWFIFLWYPSQIKFKHYGILHKPDRFTHLQLRLWNISN